MAQGSTSFVEAPSPVVDDEPDLSHWVCCQDTSIALCGVDQTGEEWADVPDSAHGPHDCVPCDEIHDRADCLTLCPVAALRSLKELS